MKAKQLTPFELKAFLLKLLNKINSVDDIKDCLDDFDVLDNQATNDFIAKILFKELVNASVEKIPVICFLLERYVPKNEFISKLWETLKQQKLSNEVKITILNLLRDLDSDWSYETCEEFLEDAESLLDENTKQLLKSAIINPETQIDFMDFLTTLRTQDKITLLNSFVGEYTDDAFANILVPVFVSNPSSPEGKEALKLLANTKSQIALHTLEEIQHIATDELLQEVKRSLSTLKISGIRVDNTKEFYTQILSNSKVKDCYITYPDGHGDCALIFTRITTDNKIRFVSIVINLQNGIKDCFGFFDISEFECNKIIERFLKNESAIKISAETFKTVLYNSEMTTIKNNQNNWQLPYEYVCWKNLLIDIDYDTRSYVQIIDELFKNIKLSEFNMTQFYSSEVCTHWFLDINYSQEFQELLKQLSSNDNINVLLKTSLDKVFNTAEKEDWKNRLYLSAYLKYSIDKIDETKNIYKLLNTEEILQKLFLTILQRSVYEYLLLVKYDRTIDKFGLTHEQIEDKINYIEKKWILNE